MKSRSKTIAGWGSRVVAFTACGAVLAGLGSPAGAQTVENLQRQIDTLQNEITELKRTQAEQAKKAASGEIKHSASPDLVDPEGDFTFGFRGRIQGDAVFFDEDEGGVDFNSGTAFRRARLGIEGTVYQDWAWRIEADLAGGDEVELLDAYIKYNALKPVYLQLGQFLAPNTLEDITSSRFITFLERGMFVNAFNGVGAGRKMGFGGGYVHEHFTATAGVFGENASIDSGEPDEGWGFNGRLTGAPINNDRMVVHIGASGYYRMPSETTNVRFADRPEVRVDGTRLVDITVPDVDNVLFYGLEAAAVFGPFSVQGEYGMVDVEQNVPTGANEDPTFDGYYVYASYFLTGESRNYEKGAFGRVTPRNNFDIRNGGLGAWEVAARYSVLNLNDSVFTGGEEQNITIGLNWYLNRYMRLMFNWVHFNAEDSPVAVAPATDVEGDAFAFRFQADW